MADESSLSQPACLDPAAAQSPFDRRRFLQTGLALATGVAALGSIGGCQPTPSPTQTKPFAGVRLKVAVRNDPSLAAGLRRHIGDWSGPVGAEVEVIESIDLDKPPDYDALIYPSGELGELATRGLLSILPPQRLTQPSLAWNDFFEVLRFGEGTWGRDRVAVPLGTPVLQCYLRRDVLERVKLPPPDSWSEYQALVAAIAALDPAERAALGRDGRPPAVVYEPLGPGAAVHVFLARATAYARHRSRYSTLFDFEDFEPAIDAPPFVRALEELCAAAKHGPPSQFEATFADVWRASVTGEACIALAWPQPAAAQAAPPVGVAPLWIVELPGSPEVYHEGEWEPRRGSDDSPQIPYLGCAGVVGSVTMTSGQPEAAWEFLFALSSQRFGRAARQATSAITLARDSELSAARDWLPAPSEQSEAQNYADAISAAESRPMWLDGLRIPGRDRYLSALDTAVRQAAQGHAAPAAALAAAVADWDAISVEIGIEAQRSAYRKSLGLEG